MALTLRMVGDDLVYGLACWPAGDFAGDGWSRKSCRFSWEAWWGTLQKHPILATQHAMLVFKSGLTLAIRVLEFLSHCVCKNNIFLYSATGFCLPRKFCRWLAIALAAVWHFTHVSVCSSQRKAITARWNIHRVPGRSPLRPRVRCEGVDCVCGASSPVIQHQWHVVKVAQDAIWALTTYI